MVCALIYADAASPDLPDIKKITNRSAVEKFKHAYGVYRSVPAGELILTPGEIKTPRS